MQGIKGSTKACNTGKDIAPNEGGLQGAKHVIERGKKGGFGLLNRRTSLGDFLPCELKLFDGKCFPVEACNKFLQRVLWPCACYYGRKLCLVCLG